MTLSEFNDSLSEIMKVLCIENNMVNVYTLASLGFSQLLYPKEMERLNCCHFDALDYNFKVELELIGTQCESKTFKSNKEYALYYNKLSNDVKKSKNTNSSLDKFIFTITKSEA